MYIYILPRRNVYIFFGCNLRQKAIVRDLLQLWIPYIQLSDIAASLTAHKNGVTGRLDSLKKVIITGMVMAAKTQLRKKIVRDGARVFQLSGLTLSRMLLRNGAMESPGSHYSVGLSTRTMMCG